MKNKENYVSYDDIKIYLKIIKIIFTIFLNIFLILSLSFILSSNNIRGIIPEICFTIYCFTAMLNIFNILF